MSKDPIKDLADKVRRRQNSAHRLNDHQVSALVNSAHRFSGILPAQQVSEIANSAHRLIKNSTFRSVMIFRRRYGVRLAHSHRPGGERWLRAWTHRGLERRVHAYNLAFRKMVINPAGWQI